MKNFLFSTALQSGGALVAIDHVSTEIVPVVTNQDVKQQIVALGAGIVVSVLRWAFVKWVKPLFVKNKVEIEV